MVVYALGMTAFANLKANEAEKQKLAAIRQEQAAEEMAAAARMAEAEAVLAQKEAERQVAISAETMKKALEDCK